VTEAHRPRQRVDTSVGTGADAIAAAFARHGVNVVFGQSIPSAFHLAAPAHGIRQAAYRTENAGGAMADGYARVSGRVGVVTAQNGPAATLLVAPLAEALKASVPVVALVQDVDRAVADRNAFQELDHESLFRPVAKWVRRVEHASRIDDYVDMAFTAAAGGRPGPAVLLVPGELLAAAATPGRRGACLGHCPLDRPVPDAARIAEAAAWLAGARQPLVVVGGGVHSSGAAAALADLQERCHLPVATTVMGKGTVDETHPLSIGVIGHAMGDGSPTAGLHGFVRGADVVLLAGTRTSQNGTDSWRLMPRDARYVHLDIDGAEIGRNYESLRLSGDARAGIEALTRAMTARDLSRRKETRAQFAELIGHAHAHWRERLAATLRDSHRPARPERLMAEIDRRLPADAVVVADASYASLWAGLFLTARRAGQRFISPRGLAGIGWGLPLAIGAAVAAPGRAVICIAGDGGFAHAWSELETAVRLELPIVVVVLNNGVLGFQRDAETVFHGAHTDACAMLPVDHAMIASAVGAAGSRVADDGAFGHALDEALEVAIGGRGPSVIDVAIDPEARPPLSWFRGRLPTLPAAAGNQPRTELA